MVLGGKILYLQVSLTLCSKIFALHSEVLRMRMYLRGFENRTLFLYHIYTITILLFILFSENSRVFAFDLF